MRTGSAVKQLANRFRRGGVQAEIRRQRVGGAKRHYAQSHVGAHQALQDFMDGAIAATGNNRVAAAAHCFFSQYACAAGRDGFQRFGFNTRFAQDGERLVDGCATPPWSAGLKPDCR